MTDVLLLVLLIVINGIFAMSEMALAAAKKARLQAMAELGDAGASAAMDLHDHPTRFLSTVQIGITSIGVLNGIIGEAAFSKPVAAWISGVATGLGVHVSDAVADIAGTGLVVVVITFLTIVFGELVPKRIGQIYPETVARVVARPMQMLAFAARPFVRLLSWLTDATLRVTGLNRKSAQLVTEEEIEAVLVEGSEAGVLDDQEHQMVRNVFRLDERPISSLMVPRSDIVWLDLEAPRDAVLATVVSSQHSRFAVCRGSLDDLVGVVSARQLLEQIAGGGPLNLEASLSQPTFVPETLNGMELLATFRGADLNLAFVVDEYGVIQGLITPHDVLEAIAGEFKPHSADDAWAVQRADGSWLIDGMIPLPELKDRLGLKDLPEEDRGRYNTLAGLVMLMLGRLPKTADVVDWEGWRLEVVDMDGKRVDKVLACPSVTTVHENSALDTVIRR